MATHSSVLAWSIPGTGEPGGLPSLGSHRVGHDWSELAAAARPFQRVIESRANGTPRLLCVFSHNSSSLCFKKYFIETNDEKKIYVYLFVWLCQVLVAAHRIFSCRVQILSCSMWDQVPWPGTELGSLVLGAGSLHHWTSREVPSEIIFKIKVGEGRTREQRESYPTS